VNAATTKDAQDVDDPRPALRHVGARVLILRGECDYIAWEVTREYREVLPASILVPIGAAGHVIQQDQPQIYRELVRSFLLDEPLLLEPYTGAASPW
jgi:proline iminopeptidase